MKTYVALFETARSVIKADSAALKAGIRVSVIPVPEHLSAECGMCLVLDETEVERFRELVKQCNLKTRIYAK